MHAGQNTHTHKKLKKKKKHIEANTCFLQNPETFIGEYKT